MITKRYPFYIPLTTQALTHGGMEHTVSKLKEGGGGLQDYNRVPPLFI